MILLFIAFVAASMAGVGCFFAVAAWHAVRQLPTTPPHGDADLPGITVFRPLYRDEPLLDESLLSACRQNYPRFQVVFGVQDALDPALAAAERVRARMPDCDITVVCDNTSDGANRKIANLQNMLAAAKYDVLVIADSDIHAGPDYLRAIAAELAVPGTGLVTTLYSGLPANHSMAAALAASGISFGFLPGAALGRWLGRQDCLGATMALRRRTLAEIGGFPAILNELADDNVLGRLVRATGQRIGLAATIPATTVPESDFAGVFRHELRWARTIRSLGPAAFAFSCLQYPLAWAMLALLASGGREWACAVALATWAVRAMTAKGVEADLARRQHLSPFSARTLLMPLRDLVSVGIWMAAFTGDEVEWRGRTLRARPVPTHFTVPATATTEGND